MTKEYKKLSQELKYRYESKIRLLKTYKALYYGLVQKPDTLDDITPREVRVNNISKSELAKLIDVTRQDLRNLHVVRAFIRNIPYKMVEPNSKSRFSRFYAFNVLEAFFIKHYKNKRAGDQLWEEFTVWEELGIPSKIFAKPVKKVVEGFDGNGSVVKELVSV